MNFDITRQSLPRTILCFLLMFAVFKGRESLFSPFEVFPGEWLGSAGEWMVGILSGLPWLNTVIVFALVLVNGFYITRIISRNAMYVERTYMPALVYIMIALGYYWSPVSTVTLAVAFLLIFAIENIVHSYKQPDRIGFFFNASVAAGISVVIYPPAAVYFLFIAACLITMGRGWRDWVVSFGAFLMPVFLYSYVKWGTGEEFLYAPMRMYATLFTSVFDYYDIPESFTILEYIMAGATILILLLSVITSSRRKESVRKRAAVTYGVFMWALVFTFAMFALPCRSLAMMPVAAVPLAAIIPGYFNRRAGWMPNLLYLLLFGSVLLYNVISIIAALW